MKWISIKISKSSQVAFNKQVTIALVLYSVI